MSEPMRDRLRDELAGWPIGSGYYSTTVSVEDARDMADALLAAFPWLADEPSGGEVEAGARRMGYDADDEFDRMLAKVRADALREAAAFVEEHECYDEPRMIWETGGGTNSWGEPALREASTADGIRWLADRAEAASE